MTRDLPIDGVWARWLAGEALSDDEQSALRAYVESDPEALRSLVADESVHGRLLLLGLKEREQEPFAERVLRRLALERDGDRFAPKVTREIEDALRRRRMRRQGWTAVALLAATVVLVVWVGRDRRPALAPGESASRSVNTVTRPVGQPSSGLVAGRPAEHVPRPASAPVPLDGARIFSLDFENGDAPSLQGGRVTRGPPRPNNLRSLASAEYLPQRSLGVRLSSEGRGFFTVGPRQLFAFDYWMGTWSSGDPPALQVTLVARKDAYDYVIPRPSPVKWQTVVIPLSDFVWRPERPDPRTPRPLQPGDLVTYMKFRLDVRAQDVFYVDNIRVIGPPAGDAADSAAR